MLPRSQRVNTKRFEAVMKEGRVAHSPLFVLRWLQKEGQSNARMSAVVPKKVAKKAVLRNKLRRTIYDLARPIIEDADKVGNAFESILFVKEGVLKAQPAEISEAMKFVFKKASLI